MKSYHCICFRELHYIAIPLSDAFHRYFSSVQAVLEGACHMVAMQISAEPLVRQALRLVFKSRAVLSVRPTRKGRKVSGWSLFIYYLSSFMTISCCFIHTFFLLKTNKLCIVSSLTHSLSLNHSLDCTILGYFREGVVKYLLTVTVGNICTL